MIVFQKLENLKFNYFFVLRYVQIIDDNKYFDLIFSIHMAECSQWNISCWLEPFWSF